MSEQDVRSPLMRRSEAAKTDAPAPAGRILDGDETCRTAAAEDRAPITSQDGTVRRRSGVRPRTRGGSRSPPRTGRTGAPVTAARNGERPC